MILNKKDIEFLENLEIRLQHQAVVKTKNVKDKDLIGHREFEKFYDILDKLKKEYKKELNLTKNSLKERRKIDKSYGRPNWQKQYYRDKEEAKQKGIKFTKKLKDYKQEHKRKEVIGIWN